MGGRGSGARARMTGGFFGAGVRKTAAGKKYGVIGGSRLGKKTWEIYQKPSLRIGIRKTALGRKYGVIGGSRMGKGPTWEIYRKRPNAPKKNRASASSLKTWARRNFLWKNKAERKAIFKAEKQRWFGVKFWKPRIARIPSNKKKGQKGETFTY